MVDILETASEGGIRGLIIPEEKERVGWLNKILKSFSLVQRLGFRNGLVTPQYIPRSCPTVDMVQQITNPILLRFVTAMISGRFRFLHSNQTVASYRFALEIREILGITGRLQTSFLKEGSPLVKFSNRHWYILTDVAFIVS